MMTTAPMSIAQAPAKPNIIGIYGISGCGKSYLLNQLKDKLSDTLYTFHDGSSIIDKVVPGGLSAFQQLTESEKKTWRERAITEIQSDSAAEKTTAIITGHYLFWSDSGEPQNVGTEKDLKVYTHIFYLNTPPDTIAEYRQKDEKRQRQDLSADQLKKWQATEKKELRQACLENEIFFSVLRSAAETSDVVSDLLTNFFAFSETTYRASILTTADTILSSRKRWKSAVLFDADKTLTMEDTGQLLWELVAESELSMTEDFGGKSPSKHIFESADYSFFAFCQNALIYDEYLDDEKFIECCEKIAERVSIRPEFITFLQAICTADYVQAFVVTCGLSLIWELILDRSGFGEKIKVIGAGRATDKLIVTPSIKAELVTHLQENHNVFVWAFGDSRLDIPMMSRADRAIVVIDDDNYKGLAMDEALQTAMRWDGLRAHQVMFPPDGRPRMDPLRLPSIDLNGTALIKDVLAIRRKGNRIKEDGLKLHHATDKAPAKILMTPMRDANTTGPALRAAHRQAGWYLAIEFLADILGLEETSIPHVQGSPTVGYRLLNEARTLIVAIMRGGEPMALGVNDALRSASFLHAATAQDIDRENLRNTGTVVLVDSVINTGDTIVSFVNRLATLKFTGKIVVVAGVVQKQCVTKGFDFRSTCSYHGVELVALRLSTNKYHGSGPTDTGNRLFNTTHLLKHSPPKIRISNFGHFSHSGPKSA